MWECTFVRCVMKAQFVRMKIHTVSCEHRPHVGDINKFGHCISICVTFDESCEISEHCDRTEQRTHDRSDSQDITHCNCGFHINCCTVHDVSFCNSSCLCGSPIQHGMDVCRDFKCLRAGSDVNASAGTSDSRTQVGRGIF